MNMAVAWQILYSSFRLQFFSVSFGGLFRPTAAIHSAQVVYFMFCALYYKDSPFRTENCL